MTTRRDLDVKHYDTSSFAASILGAYSKHVSPGILYNDWNRLVQGMAHPSRVKSKIAGGIPHMPFQEFTADSVDQLLAQIKKARIPDSQIEVTSSEDGKHYTCSTPITNVLVYTSQNLGDDQEYKDLIALYQYCPGCKNAVRVL